MAKYQHAYVIPDGLKIKGGILYDRWSNFAYFADVTSLSDKALEAVDKETPVKQFNKSRFMNSKGKISVSPTTRYYSTGLRQSKGALPGFTITLADDDQRRQFTYDGNISGFVVWLKQNALVNIDLFTKTGTPYMQIPKKEV